MYHLGLRGALDGQRSKVMAALRERGVETREGFIPYNLQEIFLARGWTKESDCPIANTVAYASFYLPTGPAMTEAELDYVATQFEAVVESML